MGPTATPEHPSVYSTNDLDLAAALKTHGHEIIDTDLSQGRRAVFIFHNSPSLQIDRLAYVNNKLMVPARAFGNERRSILDVAKGAV